MFAPRPPPPTGQPKASGNQPPVVNNVKPGVICFHCGRPGHYANNCLARQHGLPPVQPSPAPVRPAPPQRPPVKADLAQARGHVNQITVEEAIDAPDVVLGMLLVNFSPATILFDFGASHSYVQNLFAVQHQLDMHTL